VAPSAVSFMRWLGLSSMCVSDPSRSAHAGVRCQAAPGQPTSKDSAARPPGLVPSGHCQHLLRVSVHDPARPQSGSSHHLISVGFQNRDQPSSLALRLTGRSPKPRHCPGLSGQDPAIRRRKPLMEPVEDRVCGPLLGAGKVPVIPKIPHRMENADGRLLGFCWRERCVADVDRHGLGDRVVAEA